MKNILRAFALITLSAIAYGQAKFEFKITDKNGAITEAKITGNKATAYQESMIKWMATQETCITTLATPAVLDIDGKVTTPEIPAVTTCIPKYPNLAELLKSHTIAIATELEKRYPASTDEPDVTAIKTAESALEAKRKARAESASKEK